MTFNIIYMSPKSNSPIGGVKVIYKNSEYINKKYSRSYIFHPEDLNFRCTWFENNVEICNSGIFNPDKDFIIIPEFWAAWFGKQALQSNLKYAIYVQNGYFLYQKPGLTAMNDVDLSNAYEGADLIISISDDTTQMIKLGFPNLDSNKIIRVKPHVGNNFVQNSKKEKIITYMPRKLSGHSERLKFFLNRNLPIDWKLQPIDGLNEQGVADVLSSSSIFLSFCEMEGCPLPPLEAAFSNNIVIGYTGEGAKEYFESPIFHEIKMGDFEAYTFKILEIVKMIDNDEFNYFNFEKCKAELLSRYSLNASEDTLDYLYCEISKLMINQLIKS